MLANAMVVVLEVVEVLLALLNFDPSRLLAIILFFFLLFGNENSRQPALSELNM